MIRIPILSVLFLLFTLTYAPRVYAGPICSGFIDCLPLTTFVLAARFGSYFLGTMLLLLGIIFYLKSLRKHRAIKLSLPLCITGLLLIIGNWYVIYKDEHRFVPQYKKIAAEADFDFYLPEYIPRGLKRGTTGITNPHDPKNPYLFVEYGGISIYEYNKAKNNISDSNCGPLNPELTLTKPGCELISTTPNGIKVYADGKDFYLKDPTRPFLYRDLTLTIENTRITISNNSLSKDEMLHLASSFKKISPDKINFVNKN